MGISYRAVHVWRRDFEVYRTTWWTNAVAPIFEPILYLLAFGAGVGTLIDKPIPYAGRDLSYVAFIAPGLLAVTMMFSSAAGTSGFTTVGRGASSRTCL